MNIEEGDIILVELKADNGWYKEPRYASVESMNGYRLEVNPLDAHSHVRKEATVADVSRVFREVEK